jgi:hypothetical protein
MIGYRLEQYDRFEWHEYRQADAKKGTKIECRIIERNTFVFTSINKINCQ